MDYDTSKGLKYDYVGVFIIFEFYGEENMFWGFFGFRGMRVMWSRR